MLSSNVTVEVDGQKLRLSNLDKVLYPKSRTTKGEVINYYSQIAEVMLPHLAGRPVTRKRWPDGVNKQPFFEKNMPRGTPSWVRTVNLPVPGSTMDRETIDFVILQDVPGIVWSANLAALELHVPQWRVGPRGAAKKPDLLVVDLDPGEGADLADCMAVAVLVRDRLAADGLQTYPKTSGSKGMQLYAPVSARQDSSVISAYAHAVADELAEKYPRKILSQMTKALRKNRVFIDWSQNNSAKTTICAYSLRGRELPWVSTPLTWDEVEAGEVVRFEPEDVLDRVQEHGDLLAGLSVTGPRVPG